MIDVISQRKFVRAVGQIGVTCVRRDETGTAWLANDGTIYTEFVGDGENFVYWRMS